VFVTLGLVLFAAVQSLMMGAQRREMVRARTAEVQPYIHVSHAWVVPSSDQSWPLTINATLVNLGKGPALSLRCGLTHPLLHLAWAGYVNQRLPGSLRVLVESTGPLLLGADGANLEVVFRGDQNFHSEPVEPGILQVRYRDLVGRWWQTEIDLRFSLVRSATGTLQTKVVPMDASEHVKGIGPPGKARVA
jgi:hypothetical protein